MLGVLAIASGLALCKPVQLAALTTVFVVTKSRGGTHFAVMAGIVLFILLHLFSVLLVPRTLPSMVTGRNRRTAGSREISREA